MLCVLPGLSTAEPECNKRILVARPTLTASSSSYASSSSSSAGSKSTGETALAGGLLLKKGSKEDAVVKKVQVYIVVPGPDKAAYVDATCPQGAADEEVSCACLCAAHMQDVNKELGSALASLGTSHMQPVKHSLRNALSDTLLRHCCKMGS